MRVEVRDGSSILPAVRDAARDAERGRGLALIESLADDWGISQERRGKSVWFEVPPEVSQPRR